MENGKRGRPRKYDHGQALENAMQVFWKKGMSGTSYEDLIQALDMNKPSIYRAFGNKESMYKQSLELFGNGVLAQIDAMLPGEQDLRSELDVFLSAAVDVYCGEEQPLGCFIACVAVTDSIAHPELQEDLLPLITAIDQKLEARCKSESSSGGIPADMDTKLFAQSIHGLLHTLAVRARAGQSKRSLNKLKDFYLKQWF